MLVFPNQICGHLAEKLSDFVLSNAYGKEEEENNNSVVVVEHGLWSRY